MKPRKPNHRTKGPGPNIIRAWFDTVFYNSLQGLATERDFLERKNWTYRFKRRRLEYIGRMAEHLPFRANENLDQFLSFYPETGQLVAEHDNAVGRLFEVCAAFHTAIVGSPSFCRIFDEVEAELGAELRNNFGAYSERADFQGILGEYLVNNVVELPDTYATSRLWNHYRGQFARALSAPELAGPKQATEAAGQVLLEVVGKLDALLRATMLQLSLEHDVPLVAEVVSGRE